jgi:peptidoglycan hydrolase-like protein with peptidoglycan-binding domain
VSRRRRGGRGRWLAAGIVVLVLAAGAVTWWVVASGGDQPAAQPLATARAVRTTLTQTVDASFTLVKENVKPLKAAAGGVVTSVGLTKGEPVKPLTPLVTIDGTALYGIPSSYPLYRNLAEGDTGSDVTALQKALAAAGYDPGAADGDFGSGTSDALVNWQASRGLSETGRLDLSQFVSYAPGAVVDEVGVDVGDRVAAGGQLAMLAPRSDLEAQADVSQLDVNRIKVGQDVTLTFDGLGGGTASGKVDDIANAAASSQGSAGSSTVVQYQVTVRMRRLPAGAMAGMTGQASVITASRRNVVVVPSSAVGGSGAAPTVQVVTDGGTLTRPVVVGLVTTQSSEILTGVRAGEEVVTGLTGGDTGLTNQNQQGGFPGGGGFLGGGGRVGGGGRNQ